MYCPKCLPNGPRAKANDAETYHDTYACPKHPGLHAMLKADANAKYLCHCGWSNIPAPPIIIPAKPTKGVK